MKTSNFYKNDIEIADFRILIYLWNRKTGKSDFLVDISNLATSGIDIKKERNNPDSMTVTIEYTQFKKKLNYEGSSPENILMPFLTEVKIQRNFKTIFAGTLYHMTLALGEVGNELLTLKCCSWGELLDNRYISEAFYGTYPEMAQKMVLAGQHEMNWFDNYAFEYEEDYFQGWTWSAATDDNPKPPRSNPNHWDGGIYLTNGQFATTYSLQSDSTYNETDRHVLPEMYFSFWYRANSCGGGAGLRLSMHADNDNNPGTERLNFFAPVSNQGSWVKYEGTIPSTNVVEDIHWLRVQAIDGNIDFSDLQLYAKPKQGDPYDLDLSIGTFDAQGHTFDNTRIRHYHRQNIKDGLYNLAKLTSSDGPDGQPDTFEYEFDEHKNFNIYYRQGNSIADPAFAAVYPGIIKSLTLERGLEDIVNLNYAEGNESRTYKDAEGKDQTVEIKWAQAYSSPSSMNRFGVMADFKSYESIKGYGDLKEAAEADLNIFDEIQDVPEIEVDSNIYNTGNVFLGDTITVKVLADELFQFINGTYRVYSLDVSISPDSVETVRLTLTPPDIAAIQLISFPKSYKYLQNDVKRLLIK